MWPEEWTAIFLDETGEQCCYRLLAKFRILVTSPDDLTTEHPDMVAVPGECLMGKFLAQKFIEKGFEYFDNALANRYIVCSHLPG